MGHLDFLLHFFGGSTCCFEQYVRESWMLFSM